MASNQAGLTEAQLTQKILQLVGAGYSQRDIAKHVKLSQTAVCHRLGALRGHPRRVVVLDIHGGSDPRGGGRDLGCRANLHAPYLTYQSFGADESSGMASSLAAVVIAITQRRRTVSVVDLRGAETTFNEQVVLTHAMHTGRNRSPCARRARVIDQRESSQVLGGTP